MSLAGSLSFSHSVVQAEADVHADDRVRRLLASLIARSLASKLPEAVEGVAGVGRGAPAAEAGDTARVDHRPRKRPRKPECLERGGE